MNIETWADGFGLWHVRVPVSGDEVADERLAHAAIVWELVQRNHHLSPVTQEFKPGRITKLDTVAEAREGTVVYVEKD